MLRPSSILFDHRGLHYVTRFIMIMICFSLCLSCASRVKKPGETPAESLYLDAMAALEDEDYITAFDLFQEVKTKYVYTQYAALAELRIADTELGQSSYISAIESYRFFIQSHPNHRKVPYAFWKIAVAYNKQRPSTLFLFPPDYEREQGTTLDTLKAVEVYLERYPRHKHSQKAQQIFADCRLYLAQHEFYVANFYLRQDKPKAALQRFLGIYEKYKDVSPLWEESAEHLKELYLQQKQTQLAKTVQSQIEYRKKIKQKKQSFKNKIIKK